MHVWVYRVAISNIFFCHLLCCGSVTDVYAAAVYLYRMANVAGDCVYHTAMTVFGILLLHPEIVIVGQVICSALLYRMAPFCLQATPAHRVCVW